VPYPERPHLKPGSGLSSSVVSFEFGRGKGYLCSNGDVAALVSEDVHFLEN